ncbi:DUF2442 domain-containing protein, partial [Fibrobacter sp.]|uniref:DUF2442 domain-containing protein n=1 Tax=Fibrobacter sp. TaxID=35828 RepID=UPI0025BF3A5E
VSNGLKLTAKNGKLATLHYKDFERLKNATPKQRLDYRISFEGLRWNDLDEDISFESIFNPEQFPLKLSSKLKPINMSEVARRLGIQQSLMAAYMNGSKHPSEKRKKAILDEIHKIANELLSI